MEITELTPIRVRLGNGLRVLALPMPNLHTAVLYAQLTVGSRFESSKDNGVSHFLEHMIYRGTPSLPSAHAQALAFEDLGCTLIATTAADAGSMAISLPPENLGSALPIFSEVFQHPLLEGIEVERGIVTEEILEGLDDDGASIDADNLIRDLTFGLHPLGLPITGTIEHLKRFDRERLLAHHRDFYVGGGTVLAVAGNIDPDKLIPQIETLFASVPAGDAPIIAPPDEQLACRFRYVPHASSQTELRVAFKAPGYHHEDEAAMDVLVRLLDDGMATRLYHEICDQRGLCYDVSGHYETYADVGLVELGAESAHERAPEVLDQLVRIISELREHGPSQAELDRIKRRHHWQQLQLLDSAGEAAEYFATETHIGQERTLVERQGQVDSLTVAELRSVAQRWFTPRGLNVVAVGMLNKGQERRLTKALANL